MDKIIIYGHKHCSSCGPAKEFMVQRGIKHAYLDLSENLLALKMFIKLRESRPEFDDIRKLDLIGIPCVVINDGEKILFDVDEHTMGEYIGG
jgi:glutaredoxin-related protein